MKEIKENLQKNRPWYPYLAQYFAFNACFIRIFDVLTKYMIKLLFPCFCWREFCTRLIPGSSRNFYNNAHSEFPSKFSRILDSERAKIGPHAVVKVYIYSLNITAYFSPLLSCLWGFSHLISTIQNLTFRPASHFNEIRAIFNQLVHVLFS